MGFRNDPGLFANDVYYSYSMDNGGTWSANERVTDQLIRRKIGVWSNGFDQRQPPGVASSDELAVFVWDDTRDGDELTQTQDIFSAAAQFQAVGSSTSTAWRYAAGGAGGPGARRPGPARGVRGSAARAGRRGGGAAGRSAQSPRRRYFLMQWTTPCRRAKALKSASRCTVNPSCSQRAFMASSIGSRSSLGRRPKVGR